MSKIYLVVSKYLPPQFPLELGVFNVLLVGTQNSDGSVRVMIFSVRLFDGQECTSPSSGYGSPRLRRTIPTNCAALKPVYCFMQLRLEWQPECLHGASHIFHRYILSQIYIQSICLDPATYCSLHSHALPLQRCRCTALYAGLPRLHFCCHACHSA